MASEASKIYQLKYNFKTLGPQKVSIYKILINTDICLNSMITKKPLHTNFFQGRTVKSVWTFHSKFQSQSIFEASEALQKTGGMIFWTRNNLDKLDWLTPQDLYYLLFWQSQGII